MSHVTHTARIVQPIPFIDASGHSHAIPVGPCVVEELSDARIGVFWGTSGEESALLPADAAEIAESSGMLVLLD